MCPIDAPANTSRPPKSDALLFTFPRLTMRVTTGATLLPLLPSGLLPAEASLLLAWFSVLLCEKDQQERLDVWDIVSSLPMIQ